MLTSGASATRRKEGATLAAPAVGATTTRLARVDALLEPVVALTRGRVFVIVVLAVYFGVSAWFIWDDTFLHDEGLLTYIFSRGLLHGGAPVFFYLKVKPVLGLLNLPGAAFGLSAFFAWHVMIGAAGLIAIAAAAKAMAAAEPGLALVVLATSPIYVAGAISGQSNVDGAAAVALTAYLMARPRIGWLAGLVVGVLPLIRFELGLLSVLCAVGALQARAARGFWCGFLVPGASYLAAGAVYHHDALWLLHYWPAFSALAGKSAVIDQEFAHQRLGNVIDALPITTPAIGLALFAPWKRRGQTQPLWGIFLVTYVAAITAFPFLQMFCGSSQRYYLAAAPAAALLAAGLSEGPPTGWRRNRRVAIGVLLAVGAAASGATLLAICLAAATGVGAIAAQGWRNLSVALGLGLALLGGAALLRHTDLERSQSEPVEDIAAWLAEHPQYTHGRPVFTNMHLLAAFLQRHGMPEVDIRCLVQPDIWVELDSQANHSNGQREALQKMMEDYFYFHGARAEELLDGRTAPGTLVILQDNPLGQQMLPPEVRADRLREVARVQNVTLSELR